MFNVTIVKGKDIIKYVLELGIVIIILLFFKEILNNRKDEFKVSDINVSEKLQKIVSDNISVVTQINNNDENLEEKLENTQIHLKAMKAIQRKR